MIVKDKLQSGKIHISGDTFQEKFNNLEGQVLTESTEGKCLILIFG
ncbi:hypothetical protein AQPE_2208 [Aquipluma nitroreducens]|uniref:Uncharacterized protein n=1 Tax=Aquipluma nitroreducens TaxID=2010828 RepID=A0A5K7S910_9BACT|nr:hypothetical protein AQPE_2208 [Aquipluma nitroreducens]